MEFPKHLHSPHENEKPGHVPVENVDYIVVQDADEQIEKMAEGWLIAPPSQTKGQEAHAKAEREKVEKAAKHKDKKAKA